MNSPIPVTAHSPMWNVLLCFKKAAFVPPPGSGAPCGFCLQALKVFSWSKGTLVLNAAQSITMRNLWVFLIPTSTMQFQLPSRDRAALRGGSPWNNWNSGSSQPEANSWGMSPPWHKQLLQSPGKPLLLGIDSSGRLTDKTSKTLHFESSFHSLLLENTN